MMVALLLYAHARDVRSSRVIQRPLRWAPRSANSGSGPVAAQPLLGSCSLEVRGLIVGVPIDAVFGVLALRENQAGRVCMTPRRVVLGGSGATQWPHGDTRAFVLPNESEIPMSATGAIRPTGEVNERPHERTQRARRLVTETEASFKTTEFFASLVLAGILVSAAVVDESNNGGFGAKQAWLYGTILTVGYMVSRGLAKSGSSEPYDGDRS
jgi:hypothetical protein